VNAQVFVPSSTKTLHLYEARFLALLDEVMSKFTFYSLYQCNVFDKSTNPNNQDKKLGLRVTPTCQVCK
jgi:hypothetical protein